MVDESVFTAPWYPWYVNDVLTSEAVDMLTLAEEGAYRRALDKAWKKGSIPADPKMCARMIGKQCSSKIAEAVLSQFIPMPDDPTRMINPKLEIVRAEQETKYHRRALAGKKGGDAKWHGHSIAIAMPEQCLSNEVATGWHSDSDTEDSLKRESEEASPAATAPETKPITVSLKTHPTIVALRSVTGICPPKEIWDEIIDRLGVDVDVGKLKKCFTAWRVRGYNKTNYDWAIEWYHSGIPEIGKGVRYGTNQKLSEREKSAQRGRNARNFADELEREARAELAAEALLLNSGPDSGENGVRHVDAGPNGNGIK